MSDEVYLDDYEEGTKTSGLAITSLVLGILSCLGLMITIVIPIAGLIFGIIGLNKINNNANRLSGKGIAISGIVTSSISVLLIPIIGILAAMVMPALAKSRAKGLQAQGKNNLKQIGLNITASMYDRANQKGGLTLPPLTSSGGGVFEDGIPDTDPFFHQKYVYSGEVINGVKIEAGAPFTAEMQNEDVKLIIIEGTDEAYETNTPRYAPMKAYSLRGDMSVR